MAAQRTYRGIPAEVRRANRRTQLLEAALDVWGSGNGTHVTMTAICQSAQLTERYFYETFSNLDHALEQVVETIGDDIQAATVEALAQAGDDPVDRVRAVVEAFVRTLLGDPRRGRAALVEAEGFESTRPRRELIMRRLARLAAREARKLNGPEAWSEHEGPLLATMFVGGVVQLVIGALDPDGPSADQVVDVATRSFRAMAAPTMTA